MITRLELTNFKKHASAQFEFTEGLNGIFGPNYSGKTTILYAILFALGGASHVPGTNLQKKGTNHGMGVVMEFEVGGRVYRVERKKSGAYLYAVDRENDVEEMIASGTSNVTEKIEELLGMSVKRFRQLKYAEQKKAHALLTVGATELHKILEELTGLDQINTVMEKLKEIVSGCSGALEVLRKEDLAPLQENERQLNNKTVELDTEVANCMAANVQMDQLLRQLSPKIVELQQSQEEHNSWRLGKVKYESQVEIHQADFDRLKPQYAPDMDSTHSEKVLSEEELQIGIIENEISDSKAKAMEVVQASESCKRLRKFIEGTHSLISRDQTDLDEMPSSLTQEMVDSAREWRDQAQIEITKAESEYDNILKVLRGSKCPTCHREYDDSVQVSQEEVDTMESALTIQKSALKKAKIDFNDLRRNLSVKTELEYDMARNAKSLAEAIEQLEKEKVPLAALKLNLKSEEQLKQSAVEVKERRKAVQSMREVVSKQIDIRRDLAKATKQLADAELSLSGLVEPDFDIEKLRDLETKHNSCSDLRKESFDALLEAEKGLATAEAELVSCRREIEHTKHSNKDYEDANKRYSTAKELQKYLRDNRDRYTGEVWDFFLGTASSFVSDCTNGTITDIQRTESGQFQFVEDDEVMGIKDASGAQEAIMGLSVQVALAHAAQCPLDILLVDEPTADMDSDHSMAVVGMLATKGHQVIAISHREMDSSLCKNVILLGE